MFKIEILPKNTKDKRTRSTKRTSIYRKMTKSKSTKPTQHNLVYVQNWNSTKKIQKIKELDVPKKRTYKKKTKS